ncbi:DsrE family protein [Planctobacterium marinum]|uniref:tRNA 5-methylaminomethyl-2-thiouridine synthase TusC n=1 Tax=Planctobacterium marinum TaxID=1631968 RepID=A0AA48HVH7_9ALTE|nr:hypothetical protein MACH26_21490 [Planctobacterium marinum]
MNKNLALLLTQSPFANSAGQDALDMAMVLGTFEIPSALFFLSDAVYQLQTVNVAKTGIKDFTKSFAALPFYDIEEIYVSELDLERRDIDASGLPDFVTPLAPLALADKLAEYKQVVRF